ncbi:hypothetical protein NDU88_002004 [Pleurodeles waltl]|uniref:Uncharacterized protein n=1 Tax=Pleurodeles waltl TaxID=8319 RepID=A0AAV7TJE9_PLEWA|nr:hypothetical protein NDU88_002004 [Pleurodeles waltl]
MSVGGHYSSDLVVFTSQGTQEAHVGKEQKEMVGSQEAHVGKEQKEIVPGDGVKRLFLPAVTRKQNRGGRRPEDFWVGSVLGYSAPGVGRVRLR